MRFPFSTKLSRFMRILFYLIMPSIYQNKMKQYFNSQQMQQLFDLLFPMFLNNGMNECQVNMQVILLPKLISGNSRLIYNSSKPLKSNPVSFNLKTAFKMSLLPPQQKKIAVSFVSEVCTFENEKEISHNSVPTRYSQV